MFVCAQSSGFNIHSVQFDKGGTLGSRELCVKWKDMTDYIRVDILAGPPTKLTIPDWDTKQVRQSVPLSSLHHKLLRTSRHRLFEYF